MGIATPRKDCAEKGSAVIRQAISCDICGTEKKQTNHWFVASDQGAELRVSGWTSRSRQRPGSKHLCGQTCLHKLVDEFMARTLTMRPPQTNTIASGLEEEASGADSNLTSKSSDREPPMPKSETTPRPIAAPVPVRLSQPLTQSPLEAPGTPPEPRTLAPALSIEEPPRFASRSWRAAAWEREREREAHAVERRPSVARRHFGS